MSLILKQYKCIHLQIPKTATSSIKQYIASCDIDYVQHKHKLPVWTKEPWKSFYTFAFVRDPVDWLMSWWFYRKCNKKYTYIKNMNFLQWVEHINNHPQTDWEYRHQHEWLLESGTPQVDYIGTYDDLEKHFNIICNKLNIPTGVLPKTNTNNSKKSVEVNNIKPLAVEMVEKYYQTDHKLYIDNKLTQCK